MEINVGEAKIKRISYKFLNKKAMFHKLEIC